MPAKVHQTVQPATRFWIILFDGERVTFQEGLTTWTMHRGYVPKIPAGSRIVRIWSDPAEGEI